MKKGIKLVLVLSIMIILLVLPITYAKTGKSTAPRVHIKNSNSLNWAGYSVFTSLSNPKSVINNVRGSWTIPSITCEFGENSYSTIWVGIDGYSSPTVEQIGTGADCSGGIPVYYAWYEMYPKFPVYLSMKVSPGDLVTAEVKYYDNLDRSNLRGSFVLSIINKNTGENFSVVEKSSSAKRTSAEWVVEAPWSSGVLPLANFNKVYFQDVSVSMKAVSGGIINPRWQYDAINMTTSDGIIKAFPTLESPSSFYVSWNHQ